MSFAGGVRWVTALAVGGIWLAPGSAFAGSADDESYPISPPSHVVDPADCDNGALVGFVDGAEPGTDVTFAFVYTLGSGASESSSVVRVADASGHAGYSVAFPPTAVSVRAVSSGQTIESLAAFEIAVTADLRGCTETSAGGGSGSGSGLVAAGSMTMTGLRVGGVLAACGAMGLIAGRRRKQADAVIA